MAEFNEVILEAARGVVGGELIKTGQERKRWKELAQLLADELKAAAGKTETISSVPAFFTAHLRRRLAQRTKPPAESEGLQKPKFGKSQTPVPENKKPIANEDALKDSPNTTKKSKFSLEECRRYADHLHKTGQGITNPGG